MHTCRWLCTNWDTLYKRTRLNKKMTTEITKKRTPNLNRRKIIPVNQHGRAASRPQRTPGCRISTPGHGSLSSFVPPINTSAKSLPRVSSFASLVFSLPRSVSRFSGELVMYISSEGANSSESRTGSGECVYTEVNMLKQQFFKYTMEWGTDY